MLNHRITLLKRAASRNAANERVNGWVDLGDTWADVRFQTGAEVLRAGADVSIVKCSIRIRARPGIDASMGVRYLGVVYKISAPMPDSTDRQYMFLVCESVK